MRKVLNAATLAVGAIVALGLVAGPARAESEGEKDFKKYCSACHTVEAGKNKIGPSLAGVVGRKAGTVPGFEYSDAIKGSGITWDQASLDRYVTLPKAAVPGGTMRFDGMAHAKDRADLIAFLVSQK
jgi:cytochrome c